MAVLKRKRHSEVLIGQLSVADNLWTRTKGLLGTSDLSVEQGLWIHNCNSIHTFFMNYAIDCVFLDQEMKVKKIVYDVKPFRLVLPIWKAKSVIELKTGTAKKLNLQTGEQLYVGH